MNEIRIRLKALRLEMLKQDLDAFYISGTDPHFSEYLTERWQTRAFITGFTGSYGIVVITQEEAGLWTDSRYFLQAEEQLRGSGIKLFKLRVPSTVLPEVWLSKKLSPNSMVGFDPLSLSVNDFRNFENTLAKNNIGLVKSPDLLDKIWENRPVDSDNQVVELDVKYAGLTRKEKREQIVAELKKIGADLQIITTLDDLAWIFNLRGNDVKFNPVFTGYGIVGKNEMILFIHKTKISAKIQARFEKERIMVLEYDSFFSWLAENRRGNFYYDPATVNYAVYEIFEKSAESVAEGISLISATKAIKNKTELEGIKRAMIKDGIALIKFLYWLKTNLTKEKITEYTAGEKLSELRGEQEEFVGDSFSPIVGYREHGAVVHYSANPENALTLSEDGILLFDSGGQYHHGTTDITRTIALGEITNQQKKDFTLVFKGMVALTNSRFPGGTKGCNLDILARKSLWENGLNYGHGTGHGIGYFLNVHEGPFSVRQEFNPFSIEPGMVLSNEPGLYREGEYGIRIENMIVCVEKEETEFGKFLGFKTLSLCPIDKKLLDINLLSKEEISWLNNYHLKVKQVLSPLLTKELQNFLDELTTPI